MPASDEKKQATGNNRKPQNIILENRDKLTVSGVLNVESFNDESVVIDTELGLLIVRGQELHINRLNLDSSELIVEGNIISFEYIDERASRKGGFFSRMFG